MSKNQMVFGSRKQADNFLKVLLDYNQAREEGEDYRYNDIHIYQEDDFIVIEWVNVPYAHDYGGRFEYVDEDGVVMESYELPDNTLMMFETKEEFDDYFMDWRQAHPEYKKNRYGRWCKEGDEDM